MPFHHQASGVYSVEWARLATGEPTDHRSEEIAGFRGLALCEGKRPSVLSTRWTMGLDQRAFPEAQRVGLDKRLFLEAYRMGLDKRLFLEVHT